MPGVQVSSQQVHLQQMSYLYFFFQKKTFLELLELLRSGLVHWIPFTSIWDTAHKRSSLCSPWWRNLSVQKLSFVDPTGLKTCLSYLQSWTKVCGQNWESISWRMTKALLYIFYIPGYPEAVKPLRFPICVFDRLLYLGKVVGSSLSPQHILKFLGTGVGSSSPTWINIWWVLPIWKPISP